MRATASQNSDSTDPAIRPSPAMPSETEVVAPGQVAGGGAPAEAAPRPAGSGRTPHEAVERLS